MLWNSRCVGCGVSNVATKAEKAIGFVRGSSINEQEHQKWNTQNEWFMLLTWSEIKHEYEDGQRI